MAVDRSPPSVVTMTTSDPTDTFHVVIAGGGVAALEAALALRAHAQHRATITMLSPQENFVYRPLSVGEPFALAPAKTVPLESVALDLDLDLRTDALASVDPDTHTAKLASGGVLSYDALLVAVGARRTRAFEHGISFRGSEDSEAVHGLIQDLEGGYLRRIAFVVPAGISWSLPLYELALMTARRAYDMNLTGVELTFVTPEERPLAIFGRGPSEGVGRLLEQAGIEITCSTYADVPAYGRVVLHPGDRTIECDRVVSLSTIAAIEVPGVPADADGFIPVDDFGHVDGLQDVFAAGDGTSFPVKQGGIACQQADAAALSLAHLAGADVEPRPFRPVLRGQLMTGARPAFMRTDISGAEGDSSTASDHTLWWPPSKVAGMYLTPYLHELELGHVPDAEGNVRDRLIMVPADGGHEFELLGFERKTRR